MSSFSFWETDATRLTDSARSYMKSPLPESPLLSHLRSGGWDSFDCFSRKNIHSHVDELKRLHTYSSADQGGAGVGYRIWRPAI